MQTKAGRCKRARPAGVRAGYGCGCCSPRRCASWLGLRLLFAPQVSELGHGARAADAAAAAADAEAARLRAAAEAAAQERAAREAELADAHARLRAAEDKVPGKRAFCQTSGRQRFEGAAWEALKSVP